jgi:FkbM family methyltransferase
MKFAKKTWLPDADSYFEQKLSDDGLWQPERLELGLKHCSHFGMALDVGAHVGTWTRIMAGKFDQVIAFEPAHDTYECLVKNTESFRHVFPIRTAMGAELGSAKITDDTTRPGNTGSRFLSEGNEVPVLTVDCLGLERLDFLKIDAEGSEYEVLMGAKSSLQRHKPTVVIEIKELGRGIDPEQAATLLREWGAREAGRTGKDRVYLWS